MATVKDITTMCKAGNVLEAYEMAKIFLQNYDKLDANNFREKYQSEEPL